jgi:hypothetical protein
MTSAEVEDKLVDVQARLAVLEERLQYRAAEQAKDYLTITKLVDQAVDLRVNVRVLETRLAIYAALGSFLGSAFMSVLVNIVFDAMRH